MIPAVDEKQPFLIAHGGSFFKLQKQARLLDDHSLRPFRRAALFVGLAWGVPLVLCLYEGSAFGQLSERPYLLDPITWARFFLTVGLLVLSETQIENQLRVVVSQFFTRNLLGKAAGDQAKTAIHRAHARRNSSRAEIICLVIAIASSLVMIYNMKTQTEASWAVKNLLGASTLTLAAWWAIIVSNTLFSFLVMRTLWRHVIWALLLSDFAHIEMKLTPAHPDGHGGIGFVGNYPNAYLLFTIAMSCIAAAVVAHQILHDTFTAKAFATVTAIWIVLVIVYFALPLSGFSRKLASLKADSLRAAGTSATAYQRQNERKQLGFNIVANEKTATAEEIADPGKLYDAAKKLSPLLLTQTSLLPVALAAILPFFAVGLTQLPIKELIPILKKLILL